LERLKFLKKEYMDSYLPSRQKSSAGSKVKH
jgi:hypothetical protein